MKDLVIQLIMNLFFKNSSNRENIYAHASIIVGYGKGRNPEGWYTHMFQEE